MSAPQLNNSTSSINYTQDKIIGMYKCMGIEQLGTGNEVIIMRHAETIADVFPDWVERSRLDDHYYYPFDLNVPWSLPRRANMKESYSVDPPVSEFGLITSQLLARHCSEKQVVPSVIYCAPTLACLQTARSIQSYYGKSSSPTIRVEPLLSTEKNSAGHWFDAQTLIRLGYKIDMEYRQLKVNGNRHYDKLSEVEQLASELRGVLRVRSDTKKGAVLFITDALGVMCMSRFARGLSTQLSGSLREVKQHASSNYPPACAQAFTSTKLDGGFTFDTSDVLNPLTFCGGSTMPNLDDGVDWRPSHAF